MRQKNKVGVASKPREIEAALREGDQRLRWLASIVESGDDAIVSKNLDGVKRLILTRIRCGERIDHFETVRQHKHGSLIVVSLTVSPVKDANDKIVGASKIARDITDKVPTIEECKTYASEYKAHLPRRLREASRTKSDEIRHRPRIRRSEVTNSWCCSRNICAPSARS